MFERFKILPKLWRTGRLTLRLLKDPRVPMTAKLVFYATVLYMLSPVDFVPDWIPVLGQADDLVAGWAMGPREVEAAACGGFFLRDPRGEGDEVLSMLPTFTSPAEASDLLRYYLARPDERTDLALKAREAVAGRTFDAHAANLLRWLS